MSKSILLEVNHPGQVHLFRYIYQDLIRKGNSVFVITKKNKSIEYLLNKLSIPYQTIGRKKDGIFQKAILQFTHNLNAFKIVRKNKVEIGIGSSITNDHVSCFSKMKSIHFSDDDEDLVPFVKKYSYPFADVIISPDSLFFKKFNYKNVKYAGTHELAYLHPNRFSPDKSVLNKLNLNENEKYFVLRFVALKGHHDKGHNGISLFQKRELIDKLKGFGKVFITSEKPIEKEFEKYRLPVPPEDIHSLLFYATMFVGDSQTMTSEAAILGTPALKCNTFAGKLSVPNELEVKYGLCYSFQPTNFNDMISKLDELLRMDNLKEEWKMRKAKFLTEKIDVSAFMVWFIENFPKSMETLKQEPDYQMKFK